jgi:hypothetical protein
MISPAAISPPRPIFGPLGARGQGWAHFIGPGFFIGYKGGSTFFFSHYQCVDGGAFRRRLFLPFPHKALYGPRHWCRGALDIL